MALAGMVLLLLAALAGGSGAGVAHYTGTLYLDGASSMVSGSFQLTTTAGAAQGTTPVAAAGLAGSGGITGTYTYIYVTSSGGALTASLASNQASPSNAPVTLTNVPVGADVYRQRVVSGAPQNNYILVGTASAVPYVDTNTTMTGSALPQADNRPAIGATGWTEFAPGVGLASSISSSSMSSSAPSTPASCKGWLVDAPGGVSFPAGTWTFQARVKPGASPNGTALLSAALYRVNDSGVPTATVIAPTDGAANMINVAGTAGTYTVSAAAAAFSLPSDEHLCVMFWRHQTVAYTSGGATGRQLAMLAWDPANQVSVHPAPNGFPSAALSSPADGLHSTSIPTLAATYSDGEADAGTLTIRLCTDPGCSTSPQSSGPLAATNGATVNWTPAGPLADGTYYWQAQGADAGGAGSWTTSRSFVLDTTAPATSITSSPSAQSNAAAGTLSFNANESVTGYQCRVDGGAYAGCTSPHPYGPLADGPHTFDVRADADLAGNAGTTTSFSWTIDTVPPDTAITSSPPTLSSSTSPSFDLWATQSGSTFECSLDGGAFAACPNPQTYSGVADGPHTFDVRAVDPAGNADPTPDSYSWTIDATPPDTTIGPSFPAALTTATGATFDFASSELPATFQCALDGAAFSTCSSPKTYSGLADGSHTFSVRALDTATNADPSPATHSWTIDTTPPTTSIGPTTPGVATPYSTATFAFSSNEAGSTFECRLDGAAFGACTSPSSYAGVSDGSHTFQVRATDAIGNVDTSPATHTWTIDRIAPSSPSLTTPADGFATGSLPHLRATFTDATPGDTGTLQFQLCSSSAPAGTACLPVVQSLMSAAVPSGATAGVLPAALADGTYHWQVRAFDAAGNFSGWTATQSFQLDTVLPSVPTLGVPADGAWVQTVQLAATFSKPSFSGTGNVEFRICSDPLCLGVVRTGSSDDVVNGGSGTWSPAKRPAGGLYYWQARAHDSSGNVSAWSESRILHLDSLAPLVIRAKPGRFLCARGSVLRLRVQVSARAVVRNRLLNRRGRVLQRGTFGALRAGSTSVRLKLPRGLRPGSYRLVLDATAERRKARATVRIHLGTHLC